MVLVLCDSFKEAQDAFSDFMTFLERCDPLSIFKVFEYSYCVETDDNFRYIFIDRRLKSLFHTFDSPDEVEMPEFFEIIDRYFFGN